MENVEFSEILISWEFIHSIRRKNEREKERKSEKRGYGLSLIERGKGCSWDGGNWVWNRVF